MPNPLKAFLQNHPDLSKALDSEQLTSISEADEIYLVRIPKSVNVKSLKGVQIALNQKTKKFHNELNAYEFVPDLSEQAPITIVTGKDLLKTVVPVGTIKMQLRSKKKPIPHDMFPMDSEPVEFPNNLKSRHPLFGSDYSDKVELNGKIKAKLDQKVSVEKKEKKKRKRETDETCALIETLLQQKAESPIGKKKLKKGENVDTSELLEALLKHKAKSIMGKKKKKSKNDYEES